MAFTSDLMFFAAAWMLAAVCGLLVTYRDRHYRDYWELLATAALAGFVSVAVLGVLLRQLGDVGTSQPYYLAIAVAVGLLGEAALGLPKVLIKYILKLHGLNDSSRQRDKDGDRD